CTPHIPPRSNRYDGITYSKAKYKKRNLIERCFNKLKQFRHIATRYDRAALNYLAMVKIAIVRLWLRFYESTTYQASRFRTRNRRGDWTELTDGRDADRSAGRGN